MRLWKALGAEDRQALLRFAEFLAARDRSATPAPLREPNLLPRPAKESVVAAIQRLSAGYPMLERGHLLDETSRLMAAHVLHGRPAREVIDELEQLFARHYHRYRGGPSTETG